MPFPSSTSPHQLPSFEWSSWTLLLYCLLTHDSASLGSCLRLFGHHRTIFYLDGKRVKSNLRKLTKEIHFKSPQSNRFLIVWMVVSNSSRSMLVKCQLGIVNWVERVRMPYTTDVCSLKKRIWMDHLYQKLSKLFSLSDVCHSFWIIALAYLYPCNFVEKSIYGVSVPNFRHSNGFQQIIPSNGIVCLDQ